MATIVKCKNGVVTDAYLELIGAALNKFENVKYCDSINACFRESSKREHIVVATAVDAFKAILHGYKKIIIWFQGVEPEESYMAHHSKLRLYILSMIEKIALERAEFCFFVSDTMRKHYEKKYGLKLERKKFYIMPCQNTSFHEEVFETKDKYDKNVFAYVGSLAVWQKFEDTIEWYKNIERMGLKDTEFRVYTFEMEKAKKLLQEAGVKNYMVDCVKNEEMPHVLADVKYGFIIREDNVVNRVATPTKISTYISCGVIPIYSECLEGFGEVAKSMKYAIVANDKIKQALICLKDISWQDVLCEYRSIFDRYYETREHLDKIQSKFQKLKD